MFLSCNEALDKGSSKRREGGREESKEGREGEREREREREGREGEKGREGERNEGREGEKRARKGGVGRERRCILLLHFAARYKFFLIRVSGDYESGIETLVGAISLIKQSPSALEERCQVHVKLFVAAVH